MTHGLSKSERICSVKAVGTLISSGHYISCGPLRCCFVLRSKTEGCSTETDGEPKLNRIMVSVPKKFFKRAVRRNLLKRRIREAYRLQKELLSATGVDMMFVYSSKEIAGFTPIYEAVGHILQTIGERLPKHDSDGQQ